MNALEIGATLFGLLQGWLVMINRRSNWIAYIIQMIFLSLFSLSVHLYGDALNSIFYIFVGIMGYILWKKKDVKRISRCSLKEKAVYLIIMAIGTYAVFLTLKNTDDPLPLLDAFTTVSSFIATYYMVMKKIDTWLIWFVNDFFYCITYWLIPETAFFLLILNIVWMFMAIASFLNWKRIMHSYTT